MTTAPISLLKTDPAGNVVVETKCTLLHGRSLIDAERIRVDDFVRDAGRTGEEFLEKTQGMVELLRRGLQRYRACTPCNWLLDLQPFLRVAPGRRRATLYRVSAVTVGFAPVRNPTSALT